MARAGRKRTYDRDSVVSRVIKGLREGTPLTQLCAAPGMPDDDTIRAWADEEPNIAKEIARAREVGFDRIAADILPIVDDLTEEPASRRVRAEARLKLLAKWDPKRYGDRVDHTSSDGSMTPKSLADFYAKPAPTSEA